MKPIFLGMASPFIAWQILGAPTGLTLWLFILLQAIAIAIGGWALWQIFRVIGESGDTYYRLHTRKFLSKEYRDS
jgi:hypothetical protein